MTGDNITSAASNFPTRSSREYWPLHLDVDGKVVLTNGVEEIYPARDPTPEELDEILTNERLYRGQAIVDYGYLGNDDVEVDENAQVSMCPTGAWVQAWVWVPVETIMDDE